MKRPVGYQPEEILVVTAEGGECPFCGGGLSIAQHRDRWVQRLDAYYHLVRQDKRCMSEVCPGPRPLYRPPEDLRFALPRKTFGFDVTVAVGERHLAGERLAAIGRDLTSQGVPITQRHVGRLFRDYLALWDASRDPGTFLQRLRDQGGVVLMADGVQFDGQSPVLYVAWDAVSGTPLLGERREFRAKDDLKSVLEGVKELDVPVRAVVTDKEKGLVPAVEEVFPKVPYQYCQTHFLFNCAKPLDEDRTALASSVRERAEGAQRVAKRIHKAELAEKAKSEEEPTRGATAEADDPVPTQPQDPQTSPGGATEVDDSPRQPQSPHTLPDLETDEGFAKEVCALARQNARRTGKAPLDPPESKRHERLNELHEVVEERRRASEKRGTVSSERWSAVRRWVGGVPLVG